MNNKTPTSSALLNRGMLLEKLGSYEAIGCYDKVIEIDPNNVDAWNIPQIRHIC